MRVKCKLCKSMCLKEICRIGEYKLTRCFSCKIVFVSPQPSRRDIRLINLKRYESPQSEETYFNMKEKFIQRAQKCIGVLDYYKKTGRLLDVGCSYGFYLETFNKVGYDAIGIDISKKAVDYIKNKLELNAIQGDFEDYLFSKNSFDVITMFDVFEHFSNPNQAIGKTRKALNKNGILVIQTPNYDSLISRITGLNWFWLLIPEHLFLYSIHSLRVLLERNGFRILKISTWDDFTEFISNVLWVLKIKNKGKTRLLYRIFSKILLILKPASLLWNSIFLGGEITVYAQKKG